MKEYKSFNNKLSCISIVILLLGLSLGSLLIYIHYNPNLTKLNELKREIEIKQEVLEKKGITPSNNYKDKEKYDLYIVNNILNPKINNCLLEEYKNNITTKEYCKEKNKTENIIFLVTGTIISITTLIFSLTIFITTKNKVIIAYEK